MLYETWPGLRDFVWSPGLPLTWCASDLWHFSFIFSVFTYKMEESVHCIWESAVQCRNYQVCLISLVLFTREMTSSWFQILSGLSWPHL